MHFMLDILPGSPAGLFVKEKLLTIGKF